MAEDHISQNAVNLHALREKQHGHRVLFQSLTQTAGKKTFGIRHAENEVQTSIIPGLPG